MHKLKNNGSENENSGIKTGRLVRGHVSAQGSLAREHVSAQGALAREHVSTQGTVAREHVFSTQGAQFSRFSK